jgi:hypothetical protein
MTKHLALLVAVATLSAGACANESARTVFGPTTVTSSTTAATSGDSQQLKRYTISGTVDSVLKPATALRNARVQVRSGADEGRFALTDASGHFVLSGLAAGTLAISVTMDGFFPWQGTVALYDDVSIDPKLEPMQ